jgi:hypothetical protein
MEKRIGFDAGRRIVTITMSGKLSRDFVFAAFDEAVADTRYEPGMTRLWDFRDADLSDLPTSTIASMAKYSRKFSPEIRQVRVAFVVSRDLEFGLTRMFQAFTPDDAATVRVFRVYDEAVSWLSRTA